MRLAEYTGALCSVCYSDVQVFVYLLMALTYFFIHVYMCMYVCVC